MADAPTGGDGLDHPIYWFLAIIVGFFVLWLFTGGPQRYEANHAEITPPTSQELGSSAASSTIQ